MSPDGDTSSEFDEEPWQKSYADHTVDIHQVLGMVYSTSLWSFVTDYIYIYIYYSIIATTIIIVIIVIVVLFFHHFPNVFDRYPILWVLESTKWKTRKGRIDSGCGSTATLKYCQ